MSRSLTIHVPAARTLLVSVAVVVVAVVLIAAGVRIGSLLVAGGPIGQFAGGADLQEIHLVNGLVYVGRLGGDDSGYLKLNDPAVVRQQASSQNASSAGQLVVQALFTDPYDASGPVLIPSGQVLLVANVASDSGLAKAYDQAIHGTPGPQPTIGPPAPSPTPLGSPVPLTSP